MLNTITRDGDDYVVAIRLAATNGKHFALLHKLFPAKYGTRAYVGKKFYIAWGNSPDLATMGLTELATLGRTPIYGTAAVKKFHSIVANSDTLKFSM